jgi:hypothetical protein
MALRKNSHQSQSDLTKLFQTDKKKSIILISQRAWSTKELNPTMLLLNNIRHKSQHTLQDQFGNFLKETYYAAILLSFVSTNNTFFGGFKGLSEISL